MKIASKSRLSLRKLFTALLAVGPLAVLPSPVWAVLPTSSSFTTTSGTVSLSSSGSTVNINFSDKAILTWGTTAGATNFNVNLGDTWNFASTGSVLNKVTKGTGVTAAQIDGSIIGSSAKVFILADGGIVVGNGAQLNTQNLILSTVPELADAIFLSTGDLTYQGGTASGAITIGSGVSVGGNLKATGSAITLGAGLSAAGDVTLTSTGAATGISFPTTTVAGNLSVTTSNGSITQTGAVTVGAGAGTQTATFNVGTGDITLNNNTNNFDRVVANAKDVTLNDANIVTLGASTISGNLTAKVGGLPGQTGVATDGALAVTGNVNVDSSTSYASGVSIGNNSSIGGYFSAKTAGGSVSLAAVGNLTIGNITNNATATTMTGGAWTAPTATAAVDGVTGAVTIAASNFDANNPASPIFAATGPTITFSSPIASAAISADQWNSVTKSTSAAGVINTTFSNLDVTPQNGGVGYSNATTTVTVVGGGGSGATASASIDNVTGTITNIRINGGTGYTTAPTIVITDAKDATAVAATGKANVNAEGRMTGITVTSNGSGYGTVAPTVTFSSQPTATSSVTITTNGTVKTVDNAGLSVSSGLITGYTVGLGGTGKYLTAPSVTVNADSITGSGSGASAVATIDASGSVTGLTLVNPGVGYTGTPTVSFGGSGTVGNITFSGPLGGGYTTVPSVTFSAPLNAYIPGTTTKTTTAKGTAVLDATGGVIGITVTDAGSGYTASPTVTFANAPAGQKNAGTSSAIPVIGVSNGAGGAYNSTPVNPVIAAGGIVSERNISITGSSIDVQGPLVSGNNQYTTTLTAAGPVTINKTVNTGRVVINSTAGDISQTATGLIVTRNNNSVLTASGNISLDSANLFSTGNATASSANLTASNASITTAQNFQTGNTTIGNNLTISTTSNRSVTLGTGTGSSATRTNVGGVLAVTANGSGTITDNNDSALTATGGMVLRSTSGAIALDAATFPGAFTPSIQSGAISASTTGNVTLAETTTLNLGNITAGNLTASSSTGSIIDSGTIGVTGTATFTVTGNNNVVLDTPVTDATLTTLASSSSIGKIAIDGGANNSITNLNGALEVVSINNATGTTTIGTAYSTAAGTASLNQPIKLGNITTGNLTVNAGGYIEVAGYGQISGNLSLTANGVVKDSNTLGASLVAPTATVNANSGRVTALATTTPTKTFQMLTFTAPPAVDIGAPSSLPTVTALATSSLNAFGQITGYTVSNGATAPFNGTYATAPTVTLYSNGSATTVGAPTNTSVVQTANGVLKVGGTTTIQSSGDAVLYRNNDFNNVVLTNAAGGGVILNDINNVTVSGTSARYVSVTAGSDGTSAGGAGNVGSQLTEAGAWGVTLGNLNVGSLYVVTNNGGAGNSGRIVQSTGATIFSQGTSSFTTTNNTITIANAGNSFGRVQLTSGGGGITLVEDGTIRLGNLSSGTGTVSLTSRTGSIIEDNNVTGINTTLSTTAGGNVTLTAAAGSVTLGGATQPAGQATTGAFAARVNVSAPEGAVSLMSTGSLNLGTINANSLTASAAGELTQAAAAKVYGSSSFTSTSGNIAVTNEGNNFGRVALTGNAAISIVENGTLNLGRVTMPAAATGNFSATSVNGDIVDTGLSGVVLGGTTAVSGAGTGLVSLNAANGNITLDDPTTEFPTSAGIVFNAKNVVLSPLGSANYNVVLGAAGQTATAQNLSVTSALGTIGNNGPLTISGDASFQTATKAITLTNSGNAFGTVRFSGGAVSITEADDIQLVSGSSATGAAAFNSVNGGITIVNRGGVITLNSTGLFTAVGAITLPKLIQAAGTLTVSSAGTKDLSALSLSSDLGGKAPLFIGTGSNVDPKP